MSQRMSHPMNARLIVRRAGLGAMAIRAAAMLPALDALAVEKLVDTILY